MCLSLGEGFNVTVTRERNLVDKEDGGAIEMYVCTPAEMWTTFTHLVFVKTDANGSKYMKGIHSVHSKEDARTEETQPAAEIVFV